MATTALNRDLVRVIAEEMAYGVETAVDCWMTQIDLALTDTHLTTLGRLNAVREIVENYKHLTGKVRPGLRPRLARLLEAILMNAVYVYLIASSWVFLLGWVVLLLVAYALAFQGDSA